MTPVMASTRNSGLAGRKGPEVTETSSDKLVDEIERTRALLDERERDVLKRRMGFGMNPETCQAIGESYGFTRERTRQIEAESLGKVIKAAFWNDLFVPKLKALLLGRTFPLPEFMSESQEIARIAAAPNRAGERLI
jgi:hypothetical protein